MSTHTERTQAWLDRHFATSVAGRFRTGYERLYLPGGRVGRMPVGHVVVLARTYAVLTALATVEFQSCLDVGVGSGRLAHLIATLYGARCAGVDLSREFARAARNDFGLPTYVANAAVLPFAEAQFDLVLCSEVLEHVEQPFAVMAELWRVARRAVVITTQEVCRGSWHRRLQMAAVERNEPHAERNYFLADDFQRAFGAEVEMQALLHMPERIRLLAHDSLPGLEQTVLALTAERRLGPGSFGVLVLARKQRGTGATRVAPAAALDAVIETDRRLDAWLAERIANPPDPAAMVADVPVLGVPPPVCPECYGTLQLGQPGTVECRGCAAQFAVQQGVAELVGSAPALARSERAWAARPELEPVRRALRQPAVPLRAARAGLRAALKLAEFLRLPLPWTDKVRLARRYLRWR
jgi:SAM-dependent methyltransferase